MLELHKTITDNLCRMGISNPTNAQKAIIPMVMEGENIVATWKTGSGKTISYLAPAIDKILNGNRNDHSIAVLVLAPTRELAKQIDSVCCSLCADTDILSTAIYGGESYEKQLSELERNPQILIATPGRLEDLIFQNEIDITALSLFVLDEVDQMMRLGFRDAITRIANFRTPDTQTLAFSATISPESTALIQETIVDAEIIAEEDKRLSVENITQRGYFVENKMMDKLLIQQVQENSSKKMIVFTRSKKMADILCSHITKSGLTAEAIHSDKSQKAREYILQRFASGENTILVATDIIARGIDISDIELVINYGLPLEEEQYVHRIGRAARESGANGEAILLCPPEEKNLLNSTCSFMKQHITMNSTHPFVTLELLKALMDEPTKKKGKKK